MLQLTKPPPPAPGKRAPVPAPARKSWDQVLRECGFPATVLVIDFETYFDAELSLRKMSVIEYVTHAGFEVLGLAYGDGDHSQWIDGEDRVGMMITHMQREHGENLERCTIIMQNAQFDATILSRRYGVHPPYIVDTLGLARHHNARDRNDLGALCKRYGLKEKGDTQDFATATFRENRFARLARVRHPAPIPPMDQAKRDALGAYAINDAAQEWNLFSILLPKLSNPKTELRLMQHHIELFTKPTLRVDFQKGEDIIAKMGATQRSKVTQCTYDDENASALVSLQDEDISSNSDFQSELRMALEEAGDDVNRYMKAGKNGPILAIAKNDPQRDQLLNHRNEGVRRLMNARAAVKSWPLHIARVNRIMAQAKADGGRLPVPLKYHGAHTGRASGGEKINLQNLGSRGDPLISEVREMIVAPPDHELVIVDAAAIEARVLAWIAGQWDLVEKFATGAEVYCDFASKVLGYPVRKPRKIGGIEAVERRMGWARNAVGKIGVLGCGYGMGADKTCAYAKGAITLDIAQKIVQTYRAENKQIVKFWYDLERAFAYTAKYRKPCTMERGLSFRADPDCDVVIGLPNGRELHYPKVRVKTEVLHDRTIIEVFNAITHTWEHTWGGTLTENVVQAMSRDVLMEAMLRLEDVGCHTALHVHDELVLVTPAGKGEEVKELAVAELSRVPDWAPRLALAAEGCVSDRYGKH